MHQRAILVAAVVVLAGLGIATLFLLGVVALPNATTLGQHGHLGIFILLYLEEAGVPTLLPSEAFALYAGHILPPGLLPTVGVWLGMAAAVTLGASTLYVLSRVFGRRFLRHPLGCLVHISPAALEVAERHFRRLGPWGILIGRLSVGAMVGGEIAPFLTSPATAVVAGAPFYRRSWRRPSCRPASPAGSQNSAWL